MPRFDVAKLLNMEAHMDSELFKKLLADFPVDDNWDESIIAEAVLKKNGERRYFMEKRDLDKITKREEQRDETATSGDRKLKEQPALPAASSSSGSAAPVVIKVEHPEWAVLLPKVVILQSSEAKVGTVMTQMVRQLAELGAMNTKEGNAKLLELTSCKTLLTTEHEGALAKIAAYKYISKDAKVCEAFSKELDDHIKDLSTHLDAASAKCKRVKAWLDNC